MPKWAKIVMIALGSGFFLLGVAGYLGAKALQRGMERFEAAAEQAQYDGERFGLTALLEDCVEEAVYRLESCGEGRMICSPASGTFLWACLETATFDRHFCAGLPRPGDDGAILAWAEAACRKYGEAGDETCPSVLAVVPGFCEIQNTR